MRAPIVVKPPTFPVHDASGLHRVHVIPAWRSPRALLHPETRRPVVFRPPTYPPQDFAGRHALHVVTRVPGPALGSPLMIRPHLIDWGRRYGAARGLYRVFNAACYRFYRSTSGPPVAGSSPYATSSTLPDTPATTFADGTWYLSMSYFDGVLDSGFLGLGPNGQTCIVVTIASGASVASPPIAPLSATLQVLAGGIVRVVALYAENDSARADTWCVAYTTNGAMPNANSPTVTQAFRSSVGAQTLVLNLPAQSTGVTIKALVQVSRGSTPVYSAPSAVLVAVANAAGPSEVPGGDIWTGALLTEAS
jgi:hypothetical protein